MKKFFSLLSIVLMGASALVSCEKQQEQQIKEAEATLTISLTGIDADISTRASTTAEHSGDKTASSIQILIFDSAGFIYKSLSAAGSIKLSKGMEYQLAAVVNGPDVSDMNLTEVRGTMADLASNPFVMYGESTADLSSTDSASASIAVTSHASRVHLKSVKNNMPIAFGTITLKQAYLCNVVGQVMLDGSWSTSWYNQYGRKSLGTKITANTLTGAVDSGTSAAASTFASYSDQVIFEQATYSADSYFYCFPNSLKTAIPDNLASLTTWTDQATWLTVCGVVNGSVYYWTVNLGAKLSNGLARNNSYDVALTINNLGTSDPGTPVTEGTASLSVSVTPWTAGSEITETI